MARQHDQPKSLKMVNTFALTAMLLLALNLPTGGAIAEGAMNTSINLWLTLLLPLIYAIGVFGLVVLFCWFCNLASQRKDSKNYD